MADLISHEGIVRALESGRVRVEIVQQAACAGCKAKSMCTASESMVKEIVAIPLGQLEVGDRVLVSVEKKLGWKAVLLAFVIPFLILLLAVWALPYFVSNEYIVGLSAICSLVPYYIILHAFSRRHEQQYQFTAAKINA